LDHLFCDYVCFIKFDMFLLTSLVCCDNFVSIVVFLMIGNNGIINNDEAHQGLNFEKCENEISTNQKVKVVVILF